MNYLRFLLFLVKSVKLIPIYFKKNKLTLKNVKNFLQGNYRLFTFHDKPLYLQEQLYFRLTKMDRTCVSNKQCPCGCEIIGKQLIDDACENNCYPAMMDGETWEVYKQIYKIDMSAVKEIGLLIVYDNINFL